MIKNLFNRAFGSASANPEILPIPTVVPAATEEHLPQPTATPATTMPPAPYIEPEVIAPVVAPSRDITKSVAPQELQQQVKETTSAQAEPAPITNDHATSNDKVDYLTVEEVVKEFERQGIPRSTRAIQRYCEKGDLEWVKRQTSSGQKYFIVANSVPRAIATTLELENLKKRFTQTSPQVQPVSAPSAQAAAPQAPPKSDIDRLANAYQSHISSLERQLDTKDHQIKDLMRHAETLAERQRVTNFIFDRLQEHLPQKLILDALRSDPDDSVTSDREQGPADNELAR